MKNQVRIFKSLIITFAFILAAIINSNAQDIPHEISYQGKLLENGNPFTGTKTIAFSIGTWTETHPNVTITDGLYSVSLGGYDTPIPPETFDNSPTAILTIEIDGSLLSPVTDIVSVGYAFKSLYADTAHNAENLNGQTGSFYQSAISNNTLLLNNHTSNLYNPHSVDKQDVGLGNVQNVNVENGFTLNAGGYIASDIIKARISSNGLKLLDYNDNGIIVKSGKVGIGTINPFSLLEVNGIIHSTQGGLKFPDNTVQTTAATNGLSLPYSGSFNSSSEIFELTQTSYGGVVKYGINNFGNSEDIIDLYHSGTGKAIKINIDNQYTLESYSAIYAQMKGKGTMLKFNYTGNYTADFAIFQNNGSNQIRFDKDGTGYFNGGVWNSGADLAELLLPDVSSPALEPGDVIVISDLNNMKVSKCIEEYSTKVIGVYATKPGIILSEKDIDSDFLNEIPVGILGIIPTKVSTINGIIERGDILVSSEIPGHAMKAEYDQIKFGSVIGKALENFDGSNTGVIKVLVNVK